MDITKRRTAFIFSLLLTLILAFGPLVQNAAPVYAEGESFVKSVTYKSNGVVQEPNADGSYTVELGKNYEVDLAFGESEGNQFPADKFVYQLPSGINPVATEGDLSIDFSIVDADGNVVNKTLTGNHYTIASDGTITVTWNTNGGDAYTAFKDCGNVEFTLTFSGSFDGSSTKLTFSDSVETTIKVDDSSDVTVEKTGTYDPTTNKVKYTATVTGNKGTSHNVIVTDELKGTALKLDTDSISISKTPDSAAEPTQQSVSESGFEYKIATVNKGDVYTFTYTASVDVDEITGTGTVSQTENDISVKSDENPEPNTDTTNLGGKIDYTNISKSAVIESTDGDKVLIKWTVKYGDKNNAASLGGFTLTDKLNYKTDRFYYDTEGHDGITVQENDGTPYTVSWEDVGVTTGNEDSWSWTIPEGAAGNTEYTITYYTVYDKTDLVNSVYESNTISDGHGHSSNRGITIGKNDVSVVKKLTDLDFNNNTASWKITITVPASGIENAWLSDYYPNREINGKTYYDKLQEGSITVDGLLDGETYSITESTTSHFRIDFSSDYSSDDGTSYDLKPSTDTRTITVTFKTDMDQDWITAGKDSTSTTDREHVNNAYFHANDQSINSQDRYYTNTTSIDKTVSNYGNPVGYYDSEGNYSLTAASDTDLPVWKFRLTLNGVDGDINITDKFDTDLFEIVPESVERDDNRLVTGKSFWNSVTSTKDVDGNTSKVTVTPTSDGATLSISNDKMPKYNNDPDLYYQTYYIDYYIRVKSPEALQKLREICAEEGTSLKATLTNEVTYGSKTDKVDFYYTYQGVKKEIVKNGYVDPDDGYTYADFKIVFNPNAADMDADSDTLEAADTWSDTLAVKIDSFKFTDASGNDISDKVSYNVSGRTATFKIPDETAVTVTYRARILGTGEVNYSNTATMNGYVAGKSSTVNVESSGEGSGSVYTIYLLKHAEGNINETLKGAVFTLYKLDDSGEKVPVTDKNGDIVSFTTDENGKATLFGSQDDDGWTFYEGTQYYLREVTAPDGYAKLTEDYPFQVSSTSQDWENHLYINGDTILISDEKLTEISFTKVWNDSNNIDGIRPSSDKDSSNYFGSWLHLYKTVDGTTTEVTGYTPTITVDENDSSKWTVTYKDLPSIDGTYSVKEVIPDGVDYTADYGAEDKTSVTNGGTITNTHEHKTQSFKTSVTVTKKWADGASGDKAVIELLADGKETGMQLTLTEDNSWTASFTDLDKYDASGNEIEYTVKEITNDYNVTIEKNADGSFTVTNSPKEDSDTETIDIPVQKKWAGGAEGDEAVFVLVKNGEETDQTLVLNEDNNWQGSFTDLDKYDENGDEITYSIKEDTSSYRVVIKSDGDGGYVVTNYPKNYEEKPNSNTKKTDSKKTTDTPKTVGPKTGDSSGVMIYMMLLITAAAAAVIVIIARRRGNKER